MELQYGADMVGAEFDASMPTAIKRLQQGRMLSVSTRHFNFSGNGSYEFSVLRYAWTFHFVLLLFILYLGCDDNHGSKYIIGKSPEDNADCYKAFINVFASSAEDPEAILCYPAPPFFSHLEMPTYLPFARRLAKFPEAWLLPLFPFLIRLLVTIYHKIACRKNLIECHIEDWRITVKRILLYFVIMNIRIWVLYLGLNMLENLLLKGPTESEKCWYHEWQNDSQPNCYGRAFDFSDHIVLYFAQLLPIALTEVLHCFTIPFWFKSSATSLSSPPPSPRCKKEPINYVAVSLVMGLVYLYFIVFLGTYNTAAYYHTTSEVLVGLLISLCIQAPLCYLQCNTKWGRAREFFFGYPH